MRRILPSLFIPVLCMTVQAQSTGRITGKVTDSAGKGIAGVKVIFKRTDINQTIEIVTGSDGRFFRIMDPKNFDIIIEHPGYAKIQDNIKIPLGLEEKKNFTLLTTDEQMKKAIASGAISDPSLAAQADSTNAYNQAVGLFNQKNYVEALPFGEKAYAGMKEAAEKAKTEDAKKEANEKIASMEKLVGPLYFEVGQSDQARRAELWGKAEPIVLRLLEGNPKSEQYLFYMASIAKSKGDAAAEKKYNDLLEAVQGPNPAKHYNEAVEAFNAGDSAKAKAALERAMKADPKYPESYYLMGMVEYGQNNLKGAKANLLKYLELAPTGAKAGDVKEMLADASLKSIKL